MAGIDVGSLVLQLSADVKRFEKAMKNAQGVTNKTMREMERAARQADKKLDAHFNNMARRATAAFGAIGAALGVRELANMADQWSDLNARLTLATGSVHASADAMERLGQVANRSYSSLESTVESFLANSTALKELGYNTQQQLDYTEALNNALVISGAKGERAKTVMNALSKAMAGGKLSGQNLNTVLEQGGRVAEALADSMGVQVNQLRELGAAGKIGTREIFGITSQMGKLGKELDQMENTIGDGFTLIKNALLQYVGTADQATAISGTLAKGLVIIADNFNVLGDAALMVSSLIATSLIGRSIVPLIKKAKDAGVAIGGMIAAMRQAQTLSAGIGAVMSGGALLGGVAGLAAGGLALAYLHYADNAAKAEAASVKLREEWRKMGLIAKEVEGDIGGMVDRLDDFSEAGRLRKLEALREEMERMTKIGTIFGIGDGEIEDVLDGLRKYADASGDVNAKVADEVQKLGAAMQLVPSAAGAVKKSLEDMLKVSGVNRDVADLIAKLIKLSDELMAAETHAQSLGQSLYLENADKAIDDLVTNLRMAVSGLGTDIQVEVYQILDKFKKGEMGVDAFKEAIKSIPELAFILKNLAFDFDVVTDAISNTTKAAAEFGDKAVDLAREQQAAMEGITQEWLIQQRLFEDYAKGQEEINNLTREELELRRAISETARDFEKEAGQGAAKFISDDKLKELAQNKLEADKRRSNEGKRGGGYGRQRDNEFERITKQIQERTAALNASTAIQSTLNPLINDYGFALTKAMTAQQMLRAAEKAGVADKEGVRAAIEQLAQAYAQAEVEAQSLNETQDRLRQKLEEVQATAKDVMRGFIDDLIAGKSATEALGNALTKIGNKLIDSGLNALLGGLFGGAVGGGGGFFAGLFRADGGEVRRYPNGKITGKGTSRSDSIPTMLSNGEFVVNAAATKKYRALLEQINNGGLLQRADGGLVGGMPTLPSASYLQGLKDNRERALRVDVTPSALFDVKVTEITQSGIEKAAPLIVNQAVKQSDGRVVRNFHQAQSRSML